MQAPLGFFRFFFPLDIEEDDDPPRLSFADKRVCRLKFFLYPFGIFVLSVKKLGFYFMPSKELLYVYKVASLAKGAVARCRFLSMYLFRVHEYVHTGLA